MSLAQEASPVEDSSAYAHIYRRPGTNLLLFSPTARIPRQASITAHAYTRIPQGAVVTKSAMLSIILMNKYMLDIGMLDVQNTDINSRLAAGTSVNTTSRDGFDVMLSLNLYPNSESSVPQSIFSTYRNKYIYGVSCIMTETWDFGSITFGGGLASSGLIVQFGLEIYPIEEVSLIGDLRWIGLCPSSLGRCGPEPVIGTFAGGFRIYPFDFISIDASIGPYSIIDGTTTYSVGMNYRY